MIEVEIPEEYWPARLHPLLSGQLLTAYFGDVPEEAKKNYRNLKEALLNTLVLSVDLCRTDFWLITNNFSEYWQDWARNLEIMIGRMMHGSEYIQEAGNVLVLSKLLSTVLQTVVPMCA